jgi:hypothetical protein
VKLIKVTRKEFTFQMEREEKLFLIKLLELYPLIPSSYQQLSRSENRPENQQLLDDALAVHRRENKKKIATMFTSGRAFQENEEGSLFTIRASRVDWLLQVLNDINVGSWLILGSPDYSRKMPIALTAKTVPFFEAHYVSGQFQLALINAVSESEADGGK